MKDLRLEFLDAGEYFEVVGLEKSFRNLCVRRSTECSVTIEGDRLDGEAWVPMKGIGFSCGTPVRRVNKEKKAFEKTNAIAETNPIVVNNDEPIAKRGRGRPKGSKNKK